MLTPGRRFALALFALLVAAPAVAQTTVRVTDAQGSPVAEAVVSLHPLGQSLRAAKGASAVMDQSGLRFVPQVLVVEAGTAVAFPNSDNVRHQVYSFSEAKRFERHLYAGRRAPPELFDQPGVVTLGCNIHDWMLGYIYIVDTPYFAQTDRDGHLRLDGAPPGRYTLRVWSPRMKPGAMPAASEITVTAMPAAQRMVLDVLPPIPGNEPPADLGFSAMDEHAHAH